MSLQEIMEEIKALAPDEQRQLRESLDKLLKSNISQAIENLSMDTIRFCVRQRILKYLSVIIDLIERCFPSIQELSLQPEQDPETGEEWLVIDITIEDEVDTFLDKYNEYTDQVVSLIPWPEHDKFRLSYNII